MSTPRVATKKKSRTDRMPGGSRTLTLRRLLKLIFEDESLSDETRNRAKEVMRKLPKPRRVVRSQQ